MTEEKAIEIMKDWIVFQKAHKEKINKADELIEIQETILKALEQKDKIIEDLKEKNRRIGEIYNQLHKTHIQTRKSLKGMINKQNKEIQELKADRVEKYKIIGLMAEYMEEEFAEYQLDNIYAELYNCNGMERNWTRGKEKEIEDIIKYFQKKAREENENV